MKARDTAGLARRKPVTPTGQFHQCGGQVARELFAIWIANPGLSRSNALRVLGARLALAPYWATTHAAWITKSSSLVGWLRQGLDGGWEVTEAGRSAYESIPGSVGFHLELQRLVEEGHSP